LFSSKGNAYCLVSNEENDETCCASLIDGKFSKWIILIPVLILLLIAYFIYRMYPRRISGNLQWLAVPDEFELPEKKNDISARRIVRIDSSVDSVVENMILPANFLTIVSRPDSIWGDKLILR